MTRRSATARPFVAFITAPALPGAHFDSHKALREFCHDTLDVQAQLADLRETGNSDAFAIDMAGSGFDWSEIDAMVRTRARPAEFFMAA